MKDYNYNTFLEYTARRLPDADGKWDTGWFDKALNKILNEIAKSEQLPYLVYLIRVAWEQGSTEVFKSFVLRCMEIDRRAFYLVYISPFRFDDNFQHNITGLITPQGIERIVDKNTSVEKIKFVIQIHPKAQQALIALLHAGVIQQTCFMRKKVNHPLTLDSIGQLSAPLNDNIVNLFDADRFQHIIDSIDFYLQCFDQLYRYMGAKQFTQAYMKLESDYLKAYSKLNMRSIRDPLQLLVYYLPLLHCLAKRFPTVEFNLAKWLAPLSDGLLFFYCVKLNDNRDWIVEQFTKHNELVVANRFQHLEPDNAEVDVVALEAVKKIWYPTYAYNFIASPDFRGEVTDSSKLDVTMAKDH